ncbi:hypothetical protein BCR42DRAFT_930 [Absidia repens]|uniref:Uncharacterized protein n=1 Tax=Absidia repens TaxID=90262 RepID=A0A1X2IZU5_9FUNG|nr:hypothetical protein BCR42DRAFT_930 [Absidia repens]
MYHNWQHTLIYHTIPTTIDYIDAFFLHVYNGTQLLMQTGQKIGDSLRLFREKHDWRRLAMDLGSIGYTLFWQPLVSTVTHIHQLGRLFCQGCWYGLKATWDDLRWTATVGLPMIIDWIKMTRGWVWTAHALHWCQALAQDAIFNIILVTAPVFYWLGQWMVRLGDVFGSWIQSEWVQDIFRHVRYALANSGVWLGGELVALVRSIKTMATTMVDNGLVPIIQLFMNHVLPRLSDGYQRFIAETYVVYRHYVHPAGQQLFTWCGKALWPLTHFLERYYLTFLSYLSRWQWDGILQVSAVITQSLQRMMGWLVGSMGPAINKMVSTLVYHQLPLAVEYVQFGWNKMVDNLDTSAMVSTAEQFYQVIQEQCILLFASLERTMNEWKEAQQESDTLADKGKGSKIS